MDTIFLGLAGTGEMGWRDAYVQIGKEIIEEIGLNTLLASPEMLPSPVKIDAEHKL